MMTDMYKEKVISGINPLLSVIIWILAMYGFYILWGISEILFEFSMPAIMYGVMLLVTIGFGWFLIVKVLTEYEISIEDRKLTVTKSLSKRRQTLVCLIAADNIADVCNGKKKKTKYGTVKTDAFTRPLQNGEVVYVIYKDEGSLAAVKLKGSKKLISALKGVAK